MSIIRSFETLLGEIEDVEVIRDNKQQRLYIVADGRIVAMRHVASPGEWFIPSAKPPDWIPIPIPSADATKARRRNGNHHRRI